ncbi:MAG: tripartite tricarboxylate transporter TctB family protein [Xenococcaceae cyanobacterium MO_207.B15]|nr:tripartite tricarboxylate transporter TctB family protein [Xenococcaceae cyanobacterium MO_207.B15]MDJ0744779.1 tripartite tricarboxylate transporter TctB family protein [Xenococcaceae cyanobacterium MO_167.B27]
MSTRQADILGSIALAILSIYFMNESAKLPIGYIPGEGLGGGAFPFWASLGMLICCIWNGINWLARTSESSCSHNLYLNQQGLRSFAINSGSLVVALGIIPFIGMYGAVMLFLFSHLRFIGKRSWLLTTILTLTAPIVMFFFFEVALTITLPKGMTEPLFYPLYDLFL